jgi:hypothetical protein
MTPGFTTSHKSRPLLISKLESYFRNKEVIIHSKRLIEELQVFIWKSGAVSAKAEAMDGYNDDLVMAMGISLWIRDVALRLRKEADSVTRTIIDRIGVASPQQMINNMKTLNGDKGVNPFGVYNNPWQMHVGGPGMHGAKPEDLTWLLR